MTTTEPEAEDGAEPSIRLRVPLVMELPIEYTVDGKDCDGRWKPYAEERVSNALWTKAMALSTIITDVAGYRPDGEIFLYVNNLEEVQRLFAYCHPLPMPRYHAASEQHDIIRMMQGYGTNNVRYKTLVVSGFSPKEMEAMAKYLKCGHDAHINGEAITTVLYVVDYDARDVQSDPVMIAKAFDDLGSKLYKGLDAIRALPDTVRDEAPQGRGERSTTRVVWQLDPERIANPRATDDHVMWTATRAVPSLSRIRSHGHRTDVRKE